MKDIHFHLPNDVLERLEVLALVSFNANINTANIYDPLQVGSCDQWHSFDAVEIR